MHFHVTFDFLICDNTFIENENLIYCGATVLIPSTTFGNVWLTDDCDLWGHSHISLWTVQELGGGGRRTGDMQKDSCKPFDPCVADESLKHIMGDSSPQPPP